MAKKKVNAAFRLLQFILFVVNRQFRKRNPFINSSGKVRLGKEKKILNDLRKGKVY